jgi:microcystin-dependent protein
MRRRDEPPFTGEIRAFHGDIPERGWLPCDGRRLERIRYRALEALLKDRFGSDETHFNLPDLRGRVIAGLAPEKGRHMGDTSGADGDRDKAIPYAVVNWAICVEGLYPQA